MQVSASRFDAVIKLRAPAGLRDAIDDAARRDHTTFSAWARRALVAALREAEVPIGSGGRVGSRARRPASGRAPAAAPEDSAEMNGRPRPGNPPCARSEGR